MSIDSGFTTQQRVGVILETETAVMLIEEGLVALAREINDPHRMNLPLLLLAQGFERLLKLVILLGRFESDRKIITSRTLKNKYGHQLIKLNNDVVKLMTQSGYREQSVAIRADVQFLRESEDLHVLLSVLESFALHGRYHDLEAAIGNNLQADLHGLVGQIQSQFTTNHPEYVEGIGSGEDPSLIKFHAALLADLTETVQRFARALCRTYTFGLLGQYGCKLAQQFIGFSFLETTIWIASRRLGINCN